jgi:hypothetical protein
LEAKDPDAAFCGCVIAQKMGDKAALFFIAGQLLSSQETGDALKLNENVPIRVAKEQIAWTFRYLGLLHFNKADGFNSDPSLALLYFTFGGVELGHKAALETLGKCYIRGIGTDGDIPKGIALLRQA